MHIFWAHLLFNHKMARKLDKDKIFHVYIPADDMYSCQCGRYRSNLLACSMWKSLDKIHKNHIVLENTHALIFKLVLSSSSSDFIQFSWFFFSQREAEIV